MYAEMLAEGMVPDAAQRQGYLETLKVEADRLSHLVENVLQYARLERGAPRPASGTRAAGRVAGPDRTPAGGTRGQAGMGLLVEADGSGREITIQTDPAAVEQILFNLVDNACKYAAGAADRRIHVQVEATARAVRCMSATMGRGCRPRPPAVVPAVFEICSRGRPDRARRGAGVGAGRRLAGHERRVKGRAGRRGGRLRPVPAAAVDPPSRCPRDLDPASSDGRAPGPSPARTFGRRSGGVGRPARAERPSRAARGPPSSVCAAVDPPSVPTLHAAILFL